MQHDYTKMLSSQLARCLTMKRYCSTLKVCIAQDIKCKINCTLSCDKFGVDKLDVKEVYYPGGCNDIKCRCLHYL